MLKRREQPTKKATSRIALQQDAEVGERATNAIQEPEIVLKQASRNRRCRRESLHSVLQVTANPAKSNEEVELSCPCNNPASIFRFTGARNKAKRRDRKTLSPLCCCLFRVKSASAMCWPNRREGPDFERSQVDSGKWKQATNTPDCA